MLTLVIISLTMVGSILIIASRQDTGLHQNVLTQADNVARAGLVDAMSWFKRQTIQPTKSGVPPTAYDYPDAAFNPKYDINPFVSDTMDESIGLVKEYQLSEDNLTWVRYELYRQKDPASNPYDEHAVHDITEQRIDGRENGEGWVWYLESAGYVYRRRDPAKAFNESPNEILARVRAASEIRLVTLNLPAHSAVVAYDCGKKNQEKIIVRDEGRIIAGDNNPAISWYTGNATPKIYNNAFVSDPKFGNATEPTIYNVFSVSKSELEHLADIVVENVVYLPDNLPDMTFIYVKGDAVFTPSNPLIGSGLLFVDGNLTITQNSNSVFSGFVYVAGETIIEEPTLINGMVVTNVRFEISNSSSTNISEVRYNAAILENVRTIICNYRENKSTLHVFIGIPGLE